MIIMIIAYGTLPLIMAITFYRLKKTLATLGKNIQSFPARPAYQFIGILIASPSLIALPLIRSFDFLTIFAITGVGVMGFFIAFQELIYSRYSGLYEKGIVWNAISVKFEDIDRIEKEGSNTIVFILFDRTKKVLVCQDETIALRIEQAISTLH